MVESSGASRIQVAEMGNKRQNISQEDVNQCIKDLGAWFAENAKAHYQSAMTSTPETTPEVIKGVLAAFGASDSCYLGLSLQKFNGGF